MAMTKRHKEILIGMLEGMTESEALAACRDAGIDCRVRTRDGKLTRLFSAMDYQPKRVELTVTGGIVTATEMG